MNLTFSWTLHVRLDLQAITLRSVSCAYTDCLNSTRFSSTAAELKNYPGKRPETVGGAKGDETSGGDDDDDDTEMRAQRRAHI